MEEYHGPNRRGNKQFRQIFVARNCPKHFESILGSFYFLTSCFVPDRKSVNFGHAIVLVEGVAPLVVWCVCQFSVAKPKSPHDLRVLLWKRCCPFVSFCFSSEPLILSVSQNMWCYLRFAPVFLHPFCNWVKVSLHESSVLIATSDRDNRSNFFPLPSDKFGNRSGSIS